MKRAGIIILVIGILITAFTGFNYVTKKKIVDIGNVEISQDKNHRLSWSPLIGVAVILIGGAVLLYGVKR